MFNDFAFDISDIADILNLQPVRRNNSSMYVNCPFCGDNRGKMNINFEKNVFRCNYCDECGGMIDLYAKYMNISRSDAYREILSALHTPDYSVKNIAYKPAVNQDKHQTASVEQIHQTYTMLLSMLTLSKQHREHLISRGLTEEQIERHGFKSTPSDKIQDYPYILIERGCTVRGVPGFYFDEAERKWKMKMSAKCSGTVIPVATADGLTAGAQIRLDALFDGCKYLWFSSSNEYSIYILKWSKIAVLMLR